MKAEEYVDIGQYLKDSRESLRIPIEQAAQALHIRAKYLRALENGNLDDLPGKAYIRGYIKNYVEYLGLNLEEVLEGYETVLAHKGQEFFVPEPTLKQNLPSKRILKWSAVGMVLVYAYWYFAVHDSSILTATVTEMPQEYMQILDKRDKAAMDRAWNNCMESGDVTCFMALRRQASNPERDYYDFIYTKPTAPKP